MRTFEKTGGGSAKTVHLRCGTRKYGYYHILHDHRHDWQAYASPLSLDWRTFSDWAMEQVLISTERVSREPHNRYRFSAPVMLYKGKQLRKRFRGVVVIESSKGVITSYPQG
ncbi:hypothetical protein AB0I72_07080 [Nocardiopsis sp. NPDC049922]|uniref:hypothetical protein n=1 Tax=Nocardiopsis sp. NPDC049922 TaxID=3155157 RepID=UPI0033DAA798